MDIKAPRAPHSSPPCSVGNFETPCNIREPISTRCPTAFIPPPNTNLCPPVSIEGTRSEPSSPSTGTTGSSGSSDGSEQQQQQTRKGGGHYRGITFDDILPSHMIASAPPPEEANRKQKQKRGHSKAASAPAAAPAEHRQSSTVTPPSEPPRTPTKRNYPSGKKLSVDGGGGKSRVRATARALVRGLTAVKRNSRGGGGYEAVV